MVGKFSFRSNFYGDVVANIYLYTFLLILYSFYFMKHEPEVQIFYSDRYFFISQEISHNACRC